MNTVQPLAIPSTLLCPTLHTVAAVMIALTLLSSAARPQTETPEAGTTRQEILHMVHDVQTRYGADAVMIEGNLLQQAIRSGSILEAVVSVGGLEQRNGKQFLAFKLDTGIIYNDRALSDAARPGRAWTDIVEATLRKFQTMRVPADGIAVTVGYAHKAYADEADLRAHLHDDHGELETAIFYLLLSDVAELIAERITAQQCVDRSTVLINGSPTRIVLDAPTPGDH